MKPNKILLMNMLRNFTSFSENTQTSIKNLIVEDKVFGKTSFVKITK